MTLSVTVVVRPSGPVAVRCGESHRSTCQLSPASIAANVSSAEGKRILRTSGGAHGGAEGCSTITSNPVGAEYVIRAGGGAVGLPEVGGGGGLCLLIPRMSAPRWRDDGWFCWS